MAEEDSKSREQLRKNDDNISDEKSSSESPPSKIARISPEESSGTVTTAVVPPPLNLGLNLTLATESSSAATESSKTGFTFMQLQEYYHQELIFKHILAGMPVPIHLVLPIWKSVAASYGPHHYPSCTEMAQLVCGGCHMLLMYIRGATSVQCSCRANQVAHVNCGNCHMLLRYQYGARSVKCAVCNFVTSVGVKI